MANTVSETIVRLTLDRAAQQNTTRGVRSIDEIIKGLGRGAAGGVQRLFSRFESGRRDVQMLRTDLQRLEDQIDAINRKPVNVTRGGSGNIDRLDTIDRFGTIGTQIAGAFGNSELANVVGLIGDSADGLSKLGIAGGVTVGVLAAVSVALSEYNKGLEQQKKGLEAALNAQDVYFKALQEFTSSDAIQDIDERTRNNERIQQQIEETERAIEHAFRFAAETLPGGDVTARALDAAGQLPTAQLREQLIELRTEFATNKQAIGRLTQGLENNAFAANDLRAAEEAFAQTRLAVIQQQIAAEQEEASLIRSASTEQVDERLASIRDEQNALRGVIDETYQLAATSADAREQARQFTDRLAELEEQERRLVENVRPLVELREREAKLIQAQTDQNQEYLDALAETVSIQNKLTELTNDYSEAAAESAARLTEIQTTLSETLGEIESDKAEELKEIERGIGKDREKIAKDQAKRLAQIERRFAFDQLSAIGERDALAAFQAKRQRDLEKAELEDDRKERTEELAETLEEQRRTLEKRYKEQEETARKAAQRAVKQETERWDKDSQIRQRAIAEQTNALRNAKNAETLLYQNVQSIAQRTGATVRAEWVNIQQATSTAMEFIRQTIQNGLMDAARRAMQPVRAGAPDAGFQFGGRGGNNLNNVPFRFTSQSGGVYVPPPQRTNTPQVVFAPTITGQTRQQVRRELQRSLNRFVEAL